MLVGTSYALSNESATGNGSSLHGGILAMPAKRFLEQHPLSLRNSRSMPSVRSASSDGASRIELQELSNRFSDEMAKIKTYCNKHLQTLCQMFEAKVDQLESKHPKLEWQIADLDGTVKALGHELHANRKRSDNLDAAVSKLRKHFEEQCVQQESLQQYSRKLVNRVLQDVSPVVSPQNTAFDQLSSTALHEELDSVAMALRREIDDVRSLCSIKPSHESLRQELKGAAELLRQELRLEMRQTVGPPISVQQIEEMHIVLGELRREVDNSKALLESGRHSSDSQGEIAKIRASSLELTRKVENHSQDLAKVQDRILRCERECENGRDRMRDAAFVLEAEQRCKDMESTCLQNSSAITDIVCDVARIKETVQTKARETDQLRDELSLLRDGSTRLREAYARIADPRSEIQEMRNGVAVLRGEFASLGPRLAAVDRHLGEFTDLRTGLDEAKAGLVDLHSVFADFCLQCGFDTSELSQPSCKFFSTSGDIGRRKSAAILAETAKDALSGISRLKAMEALEEPNEPQAAQEPECDGTSLEVATRALSQLEKRPSFHSVSGEEDVETQHVP